MSESKRMDEREIQSAVQDMVSTSISFIDGELSGERAKATDYYLAKPFGNEEEGRSQFVLSEVRDAVLGTLPSVLRVLFGPERVLEFAPRTSKDREVAEQATDYVEHVFMEDNPGFLRTYEVFKDGAVRKLGIFKWGWVESEPDVRRLGNLTQEQLELLGADPEVELTEVVQTGETTVETEEGEVQVPLFEAEMTYSRVDGRVKVWSVPPDEFIFSPETRDIHDTLYVGHKMEKTRGELIALGISEDDIEEHGGPDPDLDENEEHVARREAGGISGSEQDPDGGRANDKFLYVEGYARIDVDGDGIAELRRVCTLGSGHHIVVNEPADAVPFSYFCPDPEPHTLLGQSMADKLMDVQLLKSSLTRSMNDSLAASIFPRLGVVEGQVNIADAMNTEIGAIIRQRAPGMVQPIVTPFVGKEVLPILQYLDDVVERRTGKNKGAMGLDADALQSSTRGAVNAAVTASQAQDEMLVRIFIETALKPLFRGILKILVEKQPRPRMVKLRDQWVDVDPRGWDANMDVQVRVGIGAGTIEERVQVLMLLASEMKEIMSVLGPSNPLFGIGQLANVYATILRLKGFKDTAQYVNPLPLDWQPPQPPPGSEQQEQQSPEMVIAQAQMQIEQMKAETDKEIKGAEMQLKQQEMQMKLADQQAQREAREREQQIQHELRLREIQLEDDRQRDKQAADIQLKLKEMELKYAVQQRAAELRADIAAERATSQAGPGEGE